VNRLTYLFCRRIDEKFNAISFVIFVCIACAIFFKIIERDEFNFLFNLLTFLVVAESLVLVIVGVPLKQINKSLISDLKASQSSYQQWKNSTFIVRLVEIVYALFMCSVSVWVAGTFIWFFYFFLGRFL
jgi:L-asparagine transporter-like permease